MTVAVRTESTRALAPGSRIGRKLEILRRLGEGGMGTLWVARNLTTEAEVAIKVLRVQGGDEADAHRAERFRHEARLGGMLAHRNITRVFDLLEDDDGLLVLVMELLHGETLQARCETTGTLSGKEAVSLMVPILGALQHAHEQGVVHRDLKPSNIFLHVDPDGHATAKLLDFGIAKMQDSSVKTQAGHVLGTPSYMSPEQVRASQQLDGRSDLFSVGSVLYELITGENPFRTDSPSATLARVLELEVDPDPRIEPRLWLVIQRALSKQPYERHASAADLVDALCEAVGGAAPRSLRGETSLRRGSDPKIEADEMPAMATLTPTLTAPTLPARSPIGKVVVFGVSILLAIGGLVLLWAATSEPKPAPAQLPIAASLASPVPAPPASSEEARALPEEVGSNAQPARPIGPRATAAPRHPVMRPAGSGAAPLKPPPSASVPSVARTPGF